MAAQDKKRVAWKKDDFFYLRLKKWILPCVKIEHRWHGFDRYALINKLAA
jgi:hypothetical protein